MVWRLKQEEQLSTKRLTLPTLAGAAAPGGNGREELLTAASNQQRMMGVQTPSSNMCSIPPHNITFSEHATAQKSACKRIFVILHQIILTVFLEIFSI